MRDIYTNPVYHKIGDYCEFLAIAYFSQKTQISAHARRVRGFEDLPQVCRKFAATHARFFSVSNVVELPFFIVSSLCQVAF